MIRFLYVGDGERDRVVLPELVASVLGQAAASEFLPWARTHNHGSGHRRQIQFALRQARDLGCDGLVAVVDCDRAPARARLQQLQEGRAADRSTAAPFPTALGEARPHLEAWLLDDSAAVRIAMELPRDTQIPNVRKVSKPKAVLETLLESSPRRDERPTQVWAAIANCLEVTRCPHADETGLAAFADDVRSELGQLTGQSGG